MKQKRIVLGSGYAAVGYALTRGETLIVEERELLDTHFGLPQRSFALRCETPSTELGRRFLSICTELGITGDGCLRAAALEIALAKLVLSGDLRPLLRCRICEVRDGRVLVFTNSGHLSLEAERVLDARGEAARRGRLTILCEAKDQGKLAAALDVHFPSATLEPAPSEGHYAVCLTVDPFSEPCALRAALARSWEQGEIPAKILYVAPTLSAELPSEAPHVPTLCDDDYPTPLSALEGGVRLALSEMREEGIAC